MGGALNNFKTRWQDIEGMSHVPCIRRLLYDNIISFSTQHQMAYLQSTRTKKKEKKKKKKSTWVTEDEKEGPS